MKHAGPAALEALAPLLALLRSRADLVERTPGCFYRRSQAFLHFHEDPEGLFADVKLGGKGFTRMGVSNAVEQDLIWARVQAHLDAPA